MAGISQPIPRGTFLLGALAAGIGPLAGAITAPNRASAAVRPASIRSAASLGPLINIPQTWNNCGPATIAEVLAYWGIARTQDEVRAVLRVDGGVAGMTPYGAPSYARSVGLRTLVGVGGNQTLIKALVAAGIPVIVHQVVSLADPVGHWRPIEGFDDRQGVFTASDPYLGPNHLISYGDFASMWAQRGYAFLVLYPASRQGVVSAAVAASHWNQATAFAADLALLRTNQLDASPAGTPASESVGYRYLGMAWDAAHMGQAATARSYLRLATNAGVNQTEAQWVGAAIG
ncbi:MAG TPA: C39 family peptidase [Chloroflexota bacterium]|nr:C39 family peptidase [Chloroflexota bacterium]